MFLRRISKLPGHLQTLVAWFFPKLDLFTVVVSVWDHVIGMCTIRFIYQWGFPARSNELRSELLSCNWCLSLFCSGQQGSWHGIQEDCMCCWNTQTQVFMCCWNTHKYLCVAGAHTSIYVLLKHTQVFVCCWNTRVRFYWTTLTSVHLSPARFTHRFSTWTAPLSSLISFALLRPVTSCRWNTKVYLRDISCFELKPLRSWPTYKWRLFFKSALYSVFGNARSVLSVLLF